MKQHFTQTERKLTIEEVLNWLLVDGLISSDEEQGIRQYAIRWENRGKDLITIICDYQKEKGSRLRKKFSQHKLTEWLAAKVGLPHITIDPLKINVEAVTSICAKPYAERFNILPVKVNDECVTVAVSEPYIREWELDLQHIQKRRLNVSLPARRTLNVMLMSSMHFQNQ